MSTSTDARRFAPLSVGNGTELAGQRLAARSLGYAEGLASGQRVAAAQAQAVLDAAERERTTIAAAARADVELALSGLDRAVAQLGATGTPVLDEVADVVLQAAVALARAILGAELSVVDDAALAAVRRALAPLPTDVAVTVRLNPQDCRYVLDVHEASRADAAVRIGAHEVRLVPDLTLQRGDSVAEQAGSVVDARIEAALARALESVNGTANKGAA